MHRFALRWLSWLLGSGLIIAYFRGRWTREQGKRLLPTCPPPCPGCGSLSVSVKSRSCPSMPKTPEKVTSPGNDGKSPDTEPTSGKSASGERNLV